MHNQLLVKHHKGLGSGKIHRQKLFVIDNQQSAHFP